MLAESIPLPFAEAYWACYPSPYTYDLNYPSSPTTLPVLAPLPRFLPNDYRTCLTRPGVDKAPAYPNAPCAPCHSGRSIGTMIDAATPALFRRALSHGW